MTSNAFQLDDLLRQDLAYFLWIDIWVCNSLESSQMAKSIRKLIHWSIVGERSAVYGAHVVHVYWNRNIVVANWVHLNIQWIEWDFVPYAFENKLISHKSNENPIQFILLQRRHSSHSIKFNCVLLHIISAWMLYRPVINIYILCMRAISTFPSASLWLIKDLAFDASIHMDGYKH